MSNKLNKDLSVISVNFLKPLKELLGILSFLLCKSSDMEINSSAWLKLRSPTSNLKLKHMVSYLTPVLLCEEFSRDVYIQCCYTLLQLRYLPIWLFRIKGIHIVKHEIKSNQCLALVRQKQILRSNRYEILRKQNHEDFFIQLLNAWLHFNNSNVYRRNSWPSHIFKPTHQTRL